MPFEFDFFAEATPRT